MRATRGGHAQVGAAGALAAIALGTAALLAIVAGVSWLVWLAIGPGGAADAAGPGCAAALALPLRATLQRMRRAALGWLLGWLLWRNTRAMRETERQISQYLRLRADDDLHLDALRTLLAAQQRRQLALASEQ